jgi:hypothetical protein
MSTGLTVQARTAFGLACDVQKAAGKRSGFEPAEGDLRSGVKLFGDLRVMGFAAALQTGFADKLVVVGGIEARYRDEHIGRADAIRQMLIDDFGVAPGRVEALTSEPNSMGNLTAIMAEMDRRKLAAADCALISSAYHLPRASLDLVTSGGAALRLFPAEAFWLLGSASGEERAARKAQLVAGFGGGALAERLAAELNGIADMIGGNYDQY